MATANRMTLLANKKRVVLAKKGHKLLKEKQDVLIKSFFELVDQLKDARKQLDANLAEGFSVLTLVQAEAGSEAVRRAARAMQSTGELTYGKRTIMGVKVPEITYQAGKEQVGYSYADMPLKIDAATNAFLKALTSIITVARIETSARKLGEEIKKTKRKVNALEQRVIPTLEETIRYIKMRLEEMERENFSRLKVIKTRMET